MWVLSVQIKWTSFLKVDFSQMISNVIDCCLDWLKIREVQQVEKKKKAPRENKSINGKVKDVISHYQKGVLFAYLTMVLISF